MADAASPEQPAAASVPTTMSSDSKASVEAPANSKPASPTPSDAKAPTEAPADSKPASPMPLDPKAALAARMARFKSLQAQKESGKKATEKEVRDAQDREERMAKLGQLRTANDKAAYKLLKSEDPDFDRKRNWDYTVEESESWDKRVNKKARNRDSVAFSDFRGEANKVYKRQIRQMSKVDMEAYAAKKGETLQRQVRSGVLELVETADGDVFTVDKLGRINTPVEENYNCDHKPTKEAVDRLVEDLEKGERARLKARAARGLDDDDAGDITYINQKNKQFNEKLSRFYNRYTTEIRESFERGTAI